MNYERTVEGSLARITAALDQISAGAADELDGAAGAVVHQLLKLLLTSVEAWQADRAIRRAQRGDVK